MGGLSNPSGVKSVQRGQIYSGTRTVGTNPEVGYVDITITAVNTSKARVNVDCVIGVGASGPAAQTIAVANDQHTTAANGQGYTFGYLLNSTTIRIYAGVSGGPGFWWNGRWEVIEDN